MEIVTLTVGELQANCYLVYDCDSRDTIIIDPGDEATFITDEILRLKLKPTAIIATHGHFDHILATWELQQNFTIPFYLHPKDTFLLEKMQSSASRWLGKKIIEPLPTNVNNIYALPIYALPCLQGLTLQARQGETLQVLQLIETPGHTPGSVCLIFPKEKIIFTGDTLFTNDMVSETTHYYSSKTDLQHSVALIKKKCHGFLAYPGHGESFMV